MAVSRRTTSTSKSQAVQGRAKTKTSKGATSKKTNTTKKKAKKAQEDSIFIWTSRNERSDIPYLRGFVSIPASLIDTIESMCFYDEERDSYQLDVALFKKGGGVLSGKISKSWKLDDNDDTMDDELDDDELELDDEDEDEDEDEEDDDDDDEDEDDNDDWDVEKKTSRRPVATRKTVTRKGR